MIHKQQLHQSIVNRFVLFFVSRADLLIYGFLFLLFFLLDKQLFELWRSNLWTGVAIFGSDALENYNALADLHFIDARKHPLFSLSVNPIIAGLEMLPFITRDEAIAFVFAAIGGLNVAFAYASIKLVCNETASALGFSLTYGVLFSNLVIFTLPETYALTNLVILVYMICLLRFKGNLTVPRMLILGFIVGAAGLYNAPLLSLSVIPAFIAYRKNHNRWPRVLMPLLIIAVSFIVYATPQIFVYGSGFISYFVTYSEGYSSVSHFASFHYIGNVLLSFLLYAFIGPVDEIGVYLTPGHFMRYFDSPVRTILMFSFLLYLAYVLLKLQWKRDYLQLGILCWVAVMIMFHIYFNPREAILYSTQTLFPIIVVLVTVFREISFNHRLKVYAIWAFAALLFVNNIVTVMSTLDEPTILSLFG